MSKNYTLEEVKLISQSALGKTFGELKKIDIKTVGKESDKAFFGHLIETSLFELDVNSFSRPDFEEAGIELKVTPYKYNKDKTLSAKERLVLNIIDYMTEYKNLFETSHFLSKNSQIQILWYLWEKDINKNDLKITHEYLYSFPNDDLEIIKKDWEYIINKVREGKAHELSEADTMYLGACTKGANKNSKRKQPFSDIMAMQRAFCFKTSYMTGLVRKHIGTYENIEKFVKGNENFEDYIKNVTSKYIGKTQKELMSEFEIETTAKNVFSIIINRMFKVKSKLRDTDEFIKANIVPKTIRVEENNSIKESMSFPYFKFKDIYEKDFEDSDLREELETTKYMFCIFKKINEEYVFKGIKLWNMPEIVINYEVKSVYDETKKVISLGNIVKSVNNKGIRFTNLPGMSFNGICHVRPHGRDSRDTDRLPVIEKTLHVSEYTKQCFWINNTYILQVIEDYI